MSDVALPVTVGITGASGAPYGVRLLEVLNELHVPVRLVVSATGWRLLDEELGLGSVDSLREWTGDWAQVTVFDDEDRGATPASGSAPSRGMVVCPCSMGTLASIAQGTTRSLIERAADVCLKERRPLVLCVRETPLNKIHIRNMYRAADAGATIYPLIPTFYNRPKNGTEMAREFACRVLAHIGLPQPDAYRWKG